MKHILLFIAIAILSLIIIGIFNFKKSSENLPIVAIANYGPHSSIDACITGIKEELAKEGFIENKSIKYEIADVGFDLSIIGQMLTKLQSSHPKVIVTIGTPVAQLAKKQIHNIPLVYSVVTDPVEAGLIPAADRPSDNMTGSSDKQDLEVLLQFAKKLIPNAKTVGLLRATSESNDATLANMMQTAATPLGISVLAIPVDRALDMQISMQGFKDKADFIYTGGSGVVQRAFPIIASESRKMGIPLFNVNQEAVKEGLAFASFGVNYEAVGHSTGKSVADILKGTDIKTLKPIYPKREDHKGIISRKKAAELGLSIPEGLTNVEIVE